MKTRNIASNFALSLIARESEVAQLGAFYSQRRHVLILGETGVGKSALIRHTRTALPFHLSSRSTALGEICDDLETEFGISLGKIKLVERKRALLNRIAASSMPVVFDGVEWTTPKLSSFLQGVMERVPVWICTRSEHSWDIGHFWTWLVRFARIELRPFHLHETNALVLAAVKRGIIPAEAMDIIGWLYRTSAGNPGQLSKLINELANGHYDLRNPRSLRLLKLDFSIHEIFPLHARTQATKGSP